MRVQRGIAVACTLAVLLAASAAAAQECAEGRARVDGHCCWPAQSWSETDHACVGAPTCPPTFAEEGETCVARAPAPDAAAPAAVAPPSAPPSATAWPTVGASEPAGVRNPEMTRGLDGGLLAAGLVVFLSGYGLAIATGIADEVSAACRSTMGPPLPCGTWPFAFVPLVGGVLSGTLETGPKRSEIYLGLGMGITATIVEVTGAIILLVALAGHVDDVRPRSHARGPSPSWSLAPGPAGSEVGLGVRLSL